MQHPNSQSSGGAHRDAGRTLVALCQHELCGAQLQPQQATAHTQAQSKLVDRSLCFWIYWPTQEPGFFLPVTSANQGRISEWEDSSFERNNVASSTRHTW